MNVLFESRGKMEFIDKGKEKITVTASGSGVIINKRYILTAAHVVQNKRPVYYSQW